MQIKIEFIFSAGSIKNQFMSMSINGQDLVVSESFSTSVVVDLPATVELTLSGKQSSDTVVKDGTIIADKYIKLEQVILDGFQIDSWKIPEQYLTLTTATEVISTDYWGKNGIARLVIDQDDPAIWLLECPKII